ncbi:enediyne biosynthesis protein [Sphaerisporangium melleum]|nr:enediyne biosynthesis protein [Sphaerisporangium melleum]
MKDDAARELLETVGEMFLTGYAYAAEARTPAEAEERLEQIPHRFRGFAYEGAGMAYAILDATPLATSGKLAGSLAGRGAEQVYLIYVGAGWAMARLPRMLWSKIHLPDPLLRWLALDGYGFHQAYFKTDQYVHGQYQDSGFRWPDGSAAYANRVIDQGIGRALWFVGGTDVEVVSSLIAKFPEHRRGDLYAGTGLAATYACGAAEDELRRFAELAGPYRPQLAQGSAFAAEARVRPGLVVPATEVATRVFCGVTPQEAARISNGSIPDQPVQGDVPAYEVWRQRIADQFVSLGGVSR